MAFGGQAASPSAHSTHKYADHAAASCAADSLAVHRRLVLPPTSTTVLPSATWTSRAKSLLNPLTRRGKSKGKKGGAASDEGKGASFELAEVAAAAIDQATKPKAADKTDIAVQVGWLTPGSVLSKCSQSCVVPLLLLYITDKTVSCGLSN